MHDRLLPWPGTETSIKSGGVLWTQTTPLSEMNFTVEYNFINTFFHNDVLHLSDW